MTNIMERRVEVVITVLFIMLTCTVFYTLASKEDIRLELRPLPDGLIFYDRKNSSSYEKYVSDLSGRLHDLEAVYKQRRNDSGAVFNPSQLESNGCSKAENFGYPKGEPCVMLILDRIGNWTPEDYSDDNLPSYLKKNPKFYKKGHVAITCDGVSAFDKENTDITQWPAYGISFKFLSGNGSPFVWVKFTRPTRGVLIAVQCKAWAQNINHDSNVPQGVAHLEILVD